MKQKEEKVDLVIPGIDFFNINDIAYYINIF